ncbi:MULTISPECIES: metal ABC transporter substrate-binding protein [Inquilinus]|uniref:Zinc/manganese transport system substrate-binding protein n=1 Tax=Inquilinus ginsengisoli TaxID=363840 RepID=A0ABU1JN19_9PROT|nr:metal ABC transporter substrate-binding protein [Inquilinus ginsengisoli]MDR6289707.1 zinc/manganese transport system substrate-binding protein [Inquilinus ginsengisoli]
MKTLFRAGLLGLSLAACALPAWAQDKTLNVVASFTVLADIVHQVGGDTVAVRSLVGPNGDPHVYEPTPQDAQALAKADVVIVSGLDLEGWMDRLITASGYKGKIIVASDGIVTRRMEDDGKEITDPHAWNSAANGVVYAQNVTKALAAADPAHAAAYQANGAKYEAELKDLDGWARREVATIPEAKRKVITSHDAFGYLGAAYGIEFRAPVGFSTESEASAGDVAKLIDQIKHEHIKAVFIENATDPRLVQQVAKASGAQMGGELYAEALSTEDGPASTYAKMFRYNITTLVGGMKQN